MLLESLSVKSLLLLEAIKEQIYKLYMKLPDQYYLNSLCDTVLL